MADLISVEFRSSFTPDFTIGTSDLLGGDQGPPPSGTGEGQGQPPPLSLSRILSRVVLGIVRPVVKVVGPLGLDKTIAPYGEPLPWWIALPILTLVIGSFAGFVWALARRWYKRAR